MTLAAVIVRLASRRSSQVAGHQHSPSQLWRSSRPLLHYARFWVPGRTNPSIRSSVGDHPSTYPRDGRTAMQRGSMFTGRAEVRERLRDAGADMLCTAKRDTRCDDRPSCTSWWDGDYLSVNHMARQGIDRSPGAGSSRV